VENRRSGFTLARGGFPRPASVSSFGHLVIRVVYFDPFPLFGRFRTIVAPLSLSLSLSLALSTCASVTDRVLIGATGPARRRDRDEIEFSIRSVDDRSISRCSVRRRKKRRREQATRCSTCPDYYGKRATSDGLLHLITCEKKRLDGIRSLVRSLAIASSSHAASRVARSRADPPIDYALRRDLRPGETAARAHSQLFGRADRAPDDRGVAGARCAPDNLGDVLGNREIWQMPSLTAVMGWNKLWA